MKNRRSTKFYNTSACIMLIMMLLSLTGALLSTSKAVLEIGPVTGAVWTTDLDGGRVNGNLYAKAQDVYLAGGPHKKGAAGLPDGIYYFQVTDPAGKQLLSSDHVSKRTFEVKYGYIYSVPSPPDGHKSNPDTTRGVGMVVQLKPFTYTRKEGGVYKVWVTNVEHYSPFEGCFGFIPSLSKTDNFKVGRALDEVPKYFELWMTEAISEPNEVTFYVSYTTDADGDPETKDPVDPWSTGQLLHYGTANGYDVFRYETSFAMGSYIYWQFYVVNAFTLISDEYGPELIDQEGKVNKEILFIVNGHKYDYATDEGLGGWTIELYRDDVKIAETQTGDDGAYELIGIGMGNFKVCEIARADEGWANATPPCHEFTVDDNNGGDFTFDFYNYKMLRISDTSDLRCELSSFDVVFTPSNEDPERYKLSSTNPGSFYYNVEKYGTPGTDVRIEVSLPPDKNNTDYDSPNFILHHAYIGSTPVVDVHVYAGRLDPGGWVPDLNEDITNLFDITASDEKHLTVEGIMPSTGEVFVTVHIDFQISGSVTWDEVQSFNDFEYTFSVEVYFSWQGVKIDLPI